MMLVPSFGNVNGYFKCNDGNNIAELGKYTCFLHSVLTHVIFFLSENPEINLFHVNVLVLDKGI